MDKETLSNYGWIVICVLVLAVMIALAGPFGTFVADAVKSTTQGLFDVNQNALDAAGIVIDDNGFANTDGGTQTPTKDPALNPDDGTTPADGDTYEYGDYKYTYRTSSNGWKVEITDKNQTTCGAILESINGEPVTDMTYTFSGCTSLTTAPVIPSSVTNMGRTFNGCKSLKTAPIIPEGVTNMEGTFSECTSLATAPVIPDSVTEMNDTFYRCSALTKAPIIPEGVTTMTRTFYSCTALTNAPTIPSTVTNMQQSFSGCTSLKTYTGSTAPDGDFSGYIIPSSVTNMYATFGSCPALTTAPVIPSSVTDASWAFSYCTSLTGTITINANPTKWTACLYNTKITSVVGDTTMASSILKTKTSIATNPTA